MTEKNLDLPDWEFFEETNNKIGIDCAEKILRVLWTRKQASGTKELVFKKVILDGLSEYVKEILSYHKGSHQPDSVVLSGTNSKSALKQIGSLFPGKCFIVDECSSLQYGFNWLIRNCKEEGLQYKCPLLEENYFELDSNSPFVKQILRQYQNAMAKVQDSIEGQYPKSLIIWCGKVVTYYVMFEDGTIKPYSVSTFSDLSFLGLAKCLTDMNFCPDILQTALEGRRENVDTQVYEILSDDANSPYGKFPPNFPAFPFGKCMDHNIGKEDLQVSDMMSSLSNFIFAQTTVVANQICKAMAIGRIYICGGFMTHPIFEKYRLFRSKIYPQAFKVSILDCDHAIALGLILQNV